MRHASLIGLSALGLGALALASCDQSANAPASKRTSEIVHLSQAPIDAVPLAPDAPRPVEAPAAKVEPETPATPEAATTQDLNTQPPATPPPAPAAPAPAQPEKPAPAPDVQPET